MVVLAALPFVILALLVARGIQEDRLEQQQARRDWTESLVGLLGQRLENHLQLVGRDQMQAVQKLVLAEGELRDALRNLVTRGTPQLAVIFDEGIRLYPPESSVASTPGEHFLLSRFAPQIDELRSLVQQSGVAWRWVYQDGTRDLVHCKALTPSTLTACVLLSSDLVGQAIDQSVNDFQSDHPNVAVALMDATGQVIAAGNNAWQTGEQTNRVALNRALGGLMAGWSVRVMDLAPSPLEGNVWSSPLIIGGIPLCAFWALLLWHLFQRQRSQLAQIQSRVSLGAYLSHDLRTPLANIRLYTDLICREVAESGSVREKTDVINQELSRLDDIASQAIELARSGKSTSRDSCFLPDEVIQKLLARARPQLECSGNYVRFVGKAGVFRMDQSAFERVVANLLDNARKHAKGSPLEIATVRDNDELILTVRDYGPSRGDHREEVQGSGLGLKSVRSLLAKNGGSLTLVEAAPGLRATVRFRQQGSRTS